MNNLNKKKELLKKINKEQKLNILNKTPPVTIEKLQPLVVKDSSKKSSKWFLGARDNELFFEFLFPALFLLFLLVFGLVSNLNESNKIKAPELIIILGDNKVLETKKLTFQERQFELEMKLQKNVIKEELKAQKSIKSFELLQSKMVEKLIEMKRMHYEKLQKNI